MKAPFWLDRRHQRNGLARAAAPSGALDEPEPLDEEDAPGELDLFNADDEALQEIAEQTPYGEVLLEDLIRRQLTLALGVAAVFLVLLFGMPLMNLLFPELVAVRMLGLPMSWLALAVLIYPLLWALGAYYVSTSRKYEDEFTKLVK
jgi:hypothetical protein